MKIGTTELLIVLAVVILIFGPSQIPKLSKMFGKSVKNFRNAVADNDEDKKTSADDDDRQDN